MQATNEIRNILAKGQAKAGANPLAVLDGIMSGAALEAVAGGIGMGDSSAAYAKMAKLRVETRVVELGRSGNEAYDRLRSAAAQIRKSLITLHEAPTGNPYVAYFNKGIVANPAVVVAELVSTGGGGVPVFEAEGGYVGVPAVIDKDFASAKLAELLDADMLVILTAVEKVAINFGKPDQKGLDTLTPDEARKYIAEKQFAPGSMLPKVQAAMSFAESKPGRVALITLLEKAAEGIEGKTGTRVQM